jgi:hypothetical protein
MAISAFGPGLAAVSDSLKALGSCRSLEHRGEVGDAIDRDRCVI